MKKKITINVNNILDILGISVFGYSIYMYEKQNLFSNDTDNAGFKRELVMCIQSIFIVEPFNWKRNYLVKQRYDRNHADSTKVSTSSCADSHVEEGVHLFMPRKSYIGLIRRKYGCKGWGNWLIHWH